MIHSLYLLYNFGCTLYAGKIDKEKIYFCVQLTVYKPPLSLYNNKCQEVINLKESSRILIEIITFFEERDWQYSITHEDTLEFYLGNRFIEVSKRNTEKLREILDEIKNW